MKCVICESDIIKLKYAIRDFSGKESYISWIIRHLKRLLSLGFYKYIHFYLPVCEACVRDFKKNSL